MKCCTSTHQTFYDCLLNIWSTEKASFSAKWLRKNKGVKSVLKSSGLVVVPFNFVQSFFPSCNGHQFPLPLGLPFYLFNRYLSLDPPKADPETKILVYVADLGSDVGNTSTAGKWDREGKAASNVLKLLLGQLELRLGGSSGSQCRAQTLELSLLMSDNLGCLSTNCYQWLVMGCLQDVAFPACLTCRLCVPKARWKVVSRLSQMSQ